MSSACTSEGHVKRLERHAGGMGGYVAGGPGIQRYSAVGEGSTLGGGGMHSHTVGAAGLATQHGLWWRTSMLPPKGRRNLTKKIPVTLFRQILWRKRPRCRLYCWRRK